MTAINCRGNKWIRGEKRNKIDILLPRIPSSRNNKMVNGTRK